ncbi:MAG: pyrrolo-quinoline quinone [Clostridia bacterium]|nr:pyrrolo-quinoline quinone [Clostridia bacterium]
MYRRQRRRFNKVKFMAAVFSVSLLALVGLLVVQGKLPWLKIDRFAKATPTPLVSGSQSPGTASGTPAASQSATPKPSATPTPTPEVTDPSQLVINVSNPPSFVSKSTVSAGTYQKKFKDGSITYSVFQNNKAVNYSPEYPVAFPSSKGYATLEGVTAFRGNNYRNAPSFGTRSIKEKKLEVIWTQDTGAISAANSFWPGSGWTGQPLLVHWPENVRNVMNIKPEFKNKDLVEVIYPILDGNIYFLDLQTGKPTRDKIKLGFSVKGTGMVDPRGYPLFYTGMGLNSNGKQTTSFKYRIYNLIDQTEIFTMPGSDPVALRKWGANDSSALLNAATDTLFDAGENGLIYKIKLNSKFDKQAKKITLSPQTTKYRYKSSYSPDQGIENSPSFYRNLMFFCDNGGTLQCLDVNKMEPVWIYNTHDDTDSSTVIEETKDGVFLYTANEIDKRCANGKGTKAPTNIRKFNALTGELIWQKDITCFYRYYINGGVLGTPLIGKDDIADRIIYPVCFTGSELDGKLVCLDKKTGNEIWVRTLDTYSWSSPVDIKSDDGKTYGLFCDYGGYMHLFDPMTGKDFDKVSLGGNIESSPSVYNDIAVVGSYARKIWGVRIK